MSVRWTPYSRRARWWPGMMCSLCGLLSGAPTAYGRATPSGSAYLPMELRPKEDLFHELNDR